VMLMMMDLSSEHPPEQRIKFRLYISPKMQRRFYGDCSCWLELFP
jgi:hypothetical protein